MACSAHQYLDAVRQYERNGRWGTCSSCPDRQGRQYCEGRSAEVFPELCVYTGRFDHQILEKPELWQPREAKDVLKG